MQIQDRIENKLRTKLAPSFLEVENESGMHSVPKDSESHFRVLIVSAMFEGKSLIERHRLVYEALSDEMRDHIHALTVTPRTPTEWAKGGPAVTSPPCRGGSHG